MKRALLIAGGTVGGLGAVLAVTPPQFGSSDSTLAIGGASAVPTANTTTDAAPAQTTAPAAKKTTTTTKKTTVAKSTAAKKSANTTAKTSTPTTTTATKAAAAETTAPAAPAPTKAASSTSNINGSFTGDAVNIGYGIVQVKITVSNGKIIDAQAVQAPSGRNDRWTNLAVPAMRQKTLAAQSSQITGVSGASYTSYGWYKSLQSALTKAGLPL